MNYQDLSSLSGFNSDQEAFQNIYVISTYLKLNSNYQHKEKRMTFLKFEKEIDPDN